MWHTQYMTILSLSPGPAETAGLLSGEGEYLGPEQILKGITSEDACRQAPGCPHSIAGLVAHLDFWQQRTLSYARGEDSWMDPAFKLGVTDFPPVAPAEWEGVLARFLGSVPELLQTAESPAGMEREVMDKCNVGYMLVSHASHNADHLGQIVLIRRLLGIWPPVGHE